MAELCGKDNEQRGGVLYSVSLEMCAAGTVFVRFPMKAMIAFV